MMKGELKRGIRFERLFPSAKLLGLVVLIGQLMSPAAGHCFDLFVGSGAPGSFSYFSGRVLCRMINNQIEDVQCRQVAAESELHNLTNLLDGSLDLSLVDSRPLFDALNKTGRYQFLDIDYKNLQALGPLYATPATLVVRNDAQVKTLDKLKGKRLNAGAPQSSQYLAVGSILKAKRWTKKDFSLFGDLPPSYARDDIKAFCYGTMQAMMYVGIHPDLSLKNILKDCDASLLNINDLDMKALISADPALWTVELAGGTYPDQPEEIETFGTRTLLVVSADFDEEIADKVVRLIDENKDNLLAAHPALSLFSSPDARESTVGIGFHPSTVRYFSTR